MKKILLFIIRLPIELLLCALVILANFEMADYLANKWLHRKSWA
jgi:hypothetical protein